MSAKTMHTYQDCSHRPDFASEAEHDRDCPAVDLSRRINLGRDLDTLRRAEEIARAHGNEHLADELYGFGCFLGTPERIAGTT